jgi:hypothetical protein
MLRSRVHEIYILTFNVKPFKIFQFGSIITEIVFSKLNFIALKIIVLYICCTVLFEFK